jgi:transcriptional regulator with XRE-family HTH domain
MYPNLKLQLWKTGLRQNRLARILNMDETLLSRIMNGFRQPTDELKGRIAEVLQTDKEWLFEADYRGLEGVQQARSQQSGK